MDWDLAIKRNREALQRILAALFALAGLENRQSVSGSTQAGDGAVSDCLLPIADCRFLLPRHLHAHVLRILRAAESAIRRLIVIAACEVVIQPRPAGEGLRPDFGGMHKDGADEPDAPVRIPAFPLLDSLKRYSFDPPRRASKFMPRICVVGITEPAPIPEKPVLSPDDPVDAAGLYRRLLSSQRALANLPREARRLARWNARTKLKLSQGRRTGRVSPLRIGRPPGGRKHPIHAVDDILKECHALARDALSPPNTS